MKADNPLVRVSTWVPISEVVRITPLPHEGYALALHDGPVVHATDEDLARARSLKK